MKAGELIQEKSWRDPTHLYSKIFRDIPIFSMGREKKFPPKGKNVLQSEEKDSYLLGI